MNSLSWFLYLVEVTENIKGTLIFSAIASTIFVGARTLAAGMHNDINDYKIASGSKDAMTYPNYKVWGASIVTMVVAASAIPSSNTMYAIAASEAGERIVKSEAVQGMASDAQKALHQWIKRQIEPEAKK